jgi:CheY-like chemotaxis protein
MLTTSTNPRDVDRILAAGFAEYLPKPLAEEQILDLCTSTTTAAAAKSTRTQVRERYQVPGLLTSSAG